MLRICMKTLKLIIDNILWDKPYWTKTTNTTCDRPKHTIKKRNTVKTINSPNHTGPTSCFLPATSIVVFTNSLLSTLQSVTSLGSIVVYQFQTEWVFLISATFVGQPHRVVHTSNGFLINFNLFKRHDAKLLSCNEFLGSLHCSG